ncbi:MAG: haloacid dehalogenase-like hydrolase [Clostridia bacterium]|nr:haloacid dehalogenase-like hydrolase [Clostridia bacterium]
MKKRVAFMYDFDYTLCKGYMFEFGFLESFGEGNEQYWQDNIDLCIKHNMDNNLGYMYLLLEIARRNNVKLTKEYINNFGQSVDLYKGLESWFDRVTEYGKKLGLEVEHYIISSGLKELIDGTKIASKVKRVFASNFAYNEDGEAFWPAQVVNYTNKTQYIFRIKKNMIDNLYDQYEVNEYIEKEKKMPYKNMVFFGDGETDIPCMKLVKDKGGFSVCVYNEEKEECRKTAERIFSEGRVNIMAKADYSENSELDEKVKELLERIAKGE